jgi:hypothetical protein
MDRNSLRGGADRSQPDLPPGGWQRVVGLGIVMTAATVLTIVTGSAEIAVMVTTPLLGFLPR